MAMSTYRRRQAASGRTEPSGRSGTGGPAGIDEDLRLLSDVVLHDIEGTAEADAENAEDGDGLAEDPRVVVEERARSFARSALEGGYSLQECLEEIGTLRSLLFDALRERVQEADPPRRPEEALDLARRASIRLHDVCAVCSDVYVDRVRKETEEELDVFVEFTRAVRHELKDNLGAAYTCAQMLADEELRLSGHERKKIVRSIPRNVRHSLDLLEGVQALFSDEGQDAAGRTPPVLLERVIEEAVRDLSDEAEVAGVRISSPEDCREVPVDGSRVRLILHNLIGNAVKYADHDKDERWVEIVLEEPDREADTDRNGVATAEEADEWVRLRVSDNGIGIDPDEEARVFNRFYRSGRGERSGSGLGLALAQAAARQLGSEIQVESAPGEGSTFRIRLPVRRARDSDPGSAPDR